MSRFRKAVAAAATGAAGALGLGLATEIPRTQAGWFALIGGAIGTGLAAGYATFRVPNEPAAVTIRR